MTASIRKRLLIFLLSATLLIWTGAAIFSYRDSRHEIEELFDAQLVQSAKALLLLSRHELYEQLAYEGRTTTKKIEHDIPEHVLGEPHPYEQSLAFQIWLDGDFLAIRSSSAPHYSLSALNDGFSDQTVDGVPWRIYSVSDPEQKMVVHVGEHHERRHQLSDMITWRLLTSLIITLPLLAILIWTGIGSALKPLRRLAKEINARRVDALDPVPATQVPEETRPLVDALNTLFGRVQRALENERRFTADAAHELRTPLAALKTQAQVALRAQDSSDRNSALQQVVSGVDRATRLVEQLLTLARLDPEATKMKAHAFATIEIAPIAEQVLADITPLALEKNIDLGLDSHGKGWAFAEPSLVSVLIRNLVENAVRYTPNGGQVNVTVASDNTGTTLTVADSGPGIPADEREKVFRRFYRQIGTEAPGSGLGLSIVQRIIEILGARIELSDSPLGGLQIIAHFAAESTEQARTH